MELKVRESTSTKTSGISDLLSYAILLGGLLTIAVTLYLVVTTYSSLPFWDGWEEIRVAADGGNLLSPAWLWRLHNEHRMVIPKLFLAADIRLFQGRQVFLLASIFAIQLMHLALLCWSMRVLGGWQGALWRTGTGLAAFCLFCPSQWENFVWGFQVCFVLPQLLATLSFVAFVLYWGESRAQLEKETSPKFLVISILSALGAALSLASGNLLWPLLFAAAVYLRLRLRAILSIAVVGAGSMLVYLYDYVQTGHTNQVASLRAPFQVLRFCSIYFISVWPLDSSRQHLALCLVVAMLLLLALPHVGKLRPFSIQLVLTMLYCLATSVITAAGRMNSGGILQATNSRYQTVALLFWCSLGLLWLGGAFLAGRQIQHSFLIALAFLLAIFVRGATRAKAQAEIVQQHAFTQRAATAALLTGVFDPVSLGEVYPEIDVLARALTYMKANRLSLFSDRVALKQGIPLASRFNLDDSNSCSGALESVALVDNSYGPGLRMIGWAFDHRRQRRPSSIVVSTDRLIVGLGATGQWGSGPHVHLVNPGLPSRYDGFVAYTRELPAGSTVGVYAILDGSPATACYIDRIAK